MIEPLFHKDGRITLSTGNDPIACFIIELA
jgi:hypothetical protein